MSLCERRRALSYWALVSSFAFVGQPSRASPFGPTTRGPFGLRFYQRKSLFEDDRRKTLAKNHNLALNTFSGQQIRLIRIYDSLEDNLPRHPTGLK
jgi:hypothetical protein